MSQDIFNNGDLMLNEDDEFVQSVVLAAAIDGNPHLRARMGMLVDLLDEPFCTITAVLMSKLNAGEFVDRHTIGHALTNCKLVHESGGFKQELTPKEAVNLIICAPAQPGQAEAYAEVLEARMQEKKRKQQKERVIALAQSLGSRP